MRALLNSWKDIASYLGRSVRTAQRWERDNRLPIHRIGRGNRAPVHAFAHEIDHWLGRGIAAKNNRIKAQQPETKKLVSQSQQLVSTSEREGLTFLSIDLDIGLTMAHSALNAGRNERKRTRNQQAARRAYDAILHFSERLKGPFEERVHLRKKLATLKRMLTKLGERF